MTDGSGSAIATLSVALCTFNGARFVGEQLRSVAAQTRLPDELVVCDDGSTDETLAIVRDFIATAPFETQIVRNPENLGYVRNFAGAIARCTGDLIALADQDDSWRPEKLERSERALVARPDAHAVFTDASLVDADLRPLGRRLWEHVGFDAEAQERFRRGEAFVFLLQRQVVTGATLMLRARVRDLILPIPTGAVHDRWIATLLAAVSELQFVDEPLIDYRQHDGNQIGARRLGLSERIAAARRRRRDHALANMPAWAREAQARLRERRYPLRDPRAVELLGEIAEHLQARATLGGSPLRRARSVARELASGRYGRFSNGLTSAAMDLFL